MPESFLVEKKLKKVWLSDKQKYAYMPVGSPQIYDSNSGVLEA